HGAAGPSQSSSDRPLFRKADRRPARSRAGKLAGTTTTAVASVFSFAPRAKDSFPQLSTGSGSAARTFALPSGGDLAVQPQGLLDHALGETPFLAPRPPAG